MVEKEYKQNNRPRDAQENTKATLVEMMKTVQELRKEFNKDIESEMKNLKIPSLN